MKYFFHREPQPQNVVPEWVSKARKSVVAPEDAYDKASPRPPTFKKPLRPLSSLRENESARFETLITPVGDPSLMVEWLRDNYQSVTIGERVKTSFDAPTGIARLFITCVYLDDNGVYFCRASNSCGTAESNRAELNCLPAAVTFTDDNFDMAAYSEERLRRIHDLEEMRSA